MNPKDEYERFNQFFRDLSRQREIEKTKNKLISNQEL